MRIISGQYRGKKLISPKSDKVRPTSDQARESVFNILQNNLALPWNDTYLLDIFTGSGAFGLEALSRGAKEITLIDLDISSASKNIGLFEKEKNKIKLIKTDATKLPPADKKYHIIFLDAPYSLGLTEKALNSLLEKQYMADNAICIAEISKTETINIPPQLELFDERTYGIAKFLFLREKI